MANEKCAVWGCIYDATDPEHRHCFCDRHWDIGLPVFMKLAIQEANDCYLAGKCSPCVLMDHVSLALIHLNVLRMLERAP